MLSHGPTCIPLSADYPGDSSNPVSPQKPLEKERSQSTLTKANQRVSQSPRTYIQWSFLSLRTLRAGNTSKLLLQLVAGHDAHNGGQTNA